MTKAERTMDEAVEEWLEAYRGHERYLAATERLFDVFADNWQGSRRYMGEAFANLRTALLRARGYKQAEIASAFPTRPDGE